MHASWANNAGTRLLQTGSRARRIEVSGGASLFSYSDPESSLSSPAGALEIADIKPGAPMFISTGTNLCSQGPTPACANNDADFPEGLPPPTLHIPFFLPLSPLFLPTTISTCVSGMGGEMGVNVPHVRVREDNGLVGCPRTFEDRSRSIPRLNLHLAHGIPFNVLFHGSDADTVDTLCTTVPYEFEIRPYPRFLLNSRCEERISSKVVINDDFNTGNA